MRPTSGQPFVRLEAVSKSYGSGSSQLEVLDQVELNLIEGETTSLVGRSGTGKSTLLSLIAGLMKYVEAHNSRETIRAEVTKVDERKCVPFKCFKALQVLEDGHEFKYFGPGVGHIATEPNYSGGEQEKEALINVVKLTPKGLAEMSAEALRLDKHETLAATLSEAEALEYVGSRQSLEPHASFRGWCVLWRLALNYDYTKSVQTSVHA